MKNMFFIICVIITNLFIGCQSEKDGTADKMPSAEKSSPAADELSEWEINHGIGPIKTKINLQPIDKSLSARGEKIYEMKCSACHKLDERYVGPPQREVFNSRTPEFIMNMILNPEEMSKRHPEVKKLLAEYLTPMTYQNVSQEDARAILEYFRAIAKKK
jgi:cytochrome c